MQVYGYRKLPKLFKRTVPISRKHGKIDFIIEFTNYIQSGYNAGEVPAVGHYVQMRNILEHSWIERMDRHDAMKKGLKELCDILHEEA